MALSDNIRKLREENGMTQQQMAEQLYVSRQTVCRWENGSRTPDLDMAERIAEIFHVSVDELISAEYFAAHGEVHREKKAEREAKACSGFYTVCGCGLSCYHIIHASADGDERSRVGDTDCAAGGGSCNRSESGYKQEAGEDE